ncbi:dynein axonemal heavy chain 1-like [Aphidius gifuensis]|uniref:dynein axonemal heavy chain 1-like n=1 Tax=Aphidius gifuensis TaxID=684658 RepID=UPI001CDCADE5|nr:dynein axonemal heavy chain 1-like [Aphidius gifuensis]
MPLDDLPTLSDDDKNIVRLLVTRNDRHKFSDEKISKVFDEVDVSYSRVMCRLAWHNLFPKLNTDQVFIKQPSQIQTGMLNFQEVNKYIHWKIIYIHPEVYNAVCQVIGNSQELSSKCFFEVNYVKSTVSLDDFECQQKKALNMTMKYLNTNWLNNVVKIIKTSFNKIGKGCFDLNQHIPYVYDVIKLKRFICLNIFIMQSILRTLVLDSLNKYLTLLETPTVSIMNVHPDFVWGNNLVDTQFPSAMNPIFRVELQIDAHGGIYLTDLLNFQKIIIERLDDAVIQSHYIKQVHPFLLQDLKFSPSLYLSSIGLLSEEVCQTRDRLKVAYEKSLIPLGAYAKEYNKYLDLYILDVTEYIASMRQEGISTLKIQEEISFQYASMQDMHQRLRDDPPNIEGIVETREYMDVVPSNVAEINEIFEQLRREYDVLDSFKWNIPDEDFQLKWICVGYPLKIEHQLIKTSERLLELSENYIKTQLIDELTLSEEIDKVSRYLIEISRQTDPEKIYNIASDVKKAWQELKMCKEQSFIFNERRRLFNMPMNTFHEHINSIEHQLEMYKILWCTASDWKKSHEAWLKNPLEDIDAEEVELTVNQMFQDAQRSVNMCNEIDKFKPHMSLLKSLRHHGIKAKHFEDLSTRTGIEISFTRALTLEGLLTLGIMDFKDDISDVSDIAQKEYTIESTLKKMMQEWQEIKMDVIDYKNTDAVVDILDTWESKLKLTQEVLNEWINLQKSWMYLEAVFTSEDISRQLPVEAKKYITMERNWRRIMKRAKENPHILQICPDKSLLESLKECISLLEIVQRGLSDYLETKRSLFPRFFFLSDDELLEILAQTKNVRAVQPHLTKCFENMKELKFVEMVMRDTLRSIISEALQLVDTTERKTWVYIQVQRLMLEALIIIEVHARDVVELLKNKNVSTINDFNWISQLRYYWINEETNYNIKIRVVNAEFPYGYEYLGNNGRLVITTLTERCYLTLCGALHLKFGGAPAGPAGTGKTETTKDLAKAFAIQCVVFNCSDQLDYLSMGKFFKGLASAGAWACFDEFNRIDIEVLSVIAQQILTIQRAQQLRADRFLFEGYDIPLKSMCSIFITMNPGYAGRTELPDNLKALFRPVAMMVPNYSLIAEISLFSYGFINAKVLAIKITATFKLSSEQLSTQDHYDFGMRAVKSVIAFAGKLNRENNNLNENQICLRALMDVNVPKFLRDDLILFEGILSDLFPGVTQLLVNFLKLSIYFYFFYYVDKVMQLYETTTVRHGLMLVGATGSGKTKCYEILQNACTNLQGNLQSDDSPFVKINKFIINPKSISLGRLYGEFDLDTHEWTDGILPYIIRKDISLNNAEKKWYIFDGPVDALWIENLNTVLDDNKKLCLTSGEIIKLQTNQTIIFEVGDLKVASPATVSRCGMVYLDDELIGVDTFDEGDSFDPPQWIKWIDDDLPIIISPSTKFADIEIPTLDTVRNSALIEYLLNSDNNVLCVGPTGSGKTLTISSKLTKGMPKKYTCNFMTFSAKTSASKTQSILESKLEKKRAGVYGASVLKKQIFFIDDLNMPLVEVYGAQPPLELLRQLFDSGGWYDSQDIGSFRQIVDVNILAAMGPPGGGRNFIDNRVLRHFHFITFPEMENNTKIKTPNCHVFYDQILKSTINLFDKISHQLLPTPDKLHYTFNLRDLSRIFQGILMADPSKIYEKGDLLALWYHENTRIMGDRLVNTSDLSWFDNTLWSCLMDHFGDIRKDSVLGEGQLFYGDFCNSFGQYQRITDTQKMETILYDIMEEYNHSSDEPMKLVLFDEAMSHICRISRILRQPRGNALLLGVGGSGRQSLAKLSSFLCNKSCFQIESRRSYTINDWHDDIKSIMLKAGISSNSIVFLFSDTQIKDEVYLEDIHNILNSGDVPNIYQPDELDKIYQSMRSSVQEAGLPINKTNLYNYYLKNLQNNLHTVLAMSPIGDAFRGYIRQFPALINCCVIDWFHPWSDKALQSVAVRFIKDIDDVQIANDTLQQIVNTCQFMHSSTINICEEFYQLLNRRNYVTPASYLEMLANYGKLLCSRKKELLSGIERLSGGLGKLSTTEIEVKQMQLMLIKMKPELESKIKNEAEKDLRQVKPMLHAAEASLKALNKNDIIEVKTMKRPPPGVVLVIEAVCIIPGKIPGEKVLDYWTPGSHLLSDPGHFLKDLTNFDKNKITEDMINKLKIYINNPSFEPDKIMFVSKACYSLCLWLHAMYNYYFVNKKIQPKMLALKTAELTLLETEKNLLIAMEKLHEVEDNIDKLKQQLNNEEIKLSKLKDDKKLCEDRMLRAVRLIDGLDDEKKRWIQNVGDIKINYDNCIGDCLIASGSIAYLSPFIDSYRLRLLHYWMNNLGDKVPHSFDCSPVSILGDTVKIRNWQIDGLPRDVYSIENAILVENSRRWPLFIDPQSQANKWIKKSVDLIRIIENCVRFGRACLIENINNELDNALDSILTKNFFYHAGKLSIKIGDNVVVYDQRFRLYITTQLSNPHYSPEIFAKLLIVNFSLTSSGLLDQMLSIVVMEERPDLEATRSELIVSCAQMKNDLKNIENRILDRLTTSEGSAIDDIDLINTLEASKFKSQEIKLKVDISEKTQIDIDNTRLYYLPVANRAQLLFFSINDLRFIDFMYQYSLEWFINIFITSVSKTEKSDDIEKRVNLINENLTYFLFTNVCRSLFEKHKLHLALLICARIKINSNTIESNEWRHFLAGETPSQEKQNPAKTWLSDRPENNSHFVDKFNYDDFQKLLLIKCLRPDRLINAIQIYVSKYLGSKFIEPQTTELSIIHKESSSTVPIVFILSSGTDPAAELFKYAEKIGMAKKLETISLGQGQGPRAELMLQQSVENGNWVFFQNCHLAPSWMPKLENLVESFPDNTHKGFRLWLTSTPTTNFPSSILENSIKLTVEPPRGIKANMMRAYVNQVAEMQDIFKSENIKTQNFKSLLFSLCLFHSVLLERRKFGSLGFNIPYEFSEGDLKICISQLYMFVMEYPSIPFEVLTYTAGQINYGGRITDDWDRRCIMTILHDYYKKESLVSGYKFDPNGHYCQLSTDQPDTCTLFEYLEYIRTLPLNDDPSIFGLDMNADISYASAEAYSCLDTLLMLQPKIIDDSSINVNENIVLLVENIINKIPQLFNIEDIQKKYPVLYEESFNTVIQQEAKRYNSLIKILSINLSDLLKALKGQTTMTEQLESTSDSLFNNKVPKLWLNRGYPSLKPLGAWIIDFVERINFMKRWIASGIPAAFWISGFYFPQAFITGTLQNYARKYKLSIDQIDFSFEVLKNIPTSKPKDGCVVYGLFLEGCRWNGMSLDVSQPKELHTEMKPILLLPVMNTVIDEQGHYDCPVYKTLTRSGTLSTTGHSTNFVLSMKIPSRESQSFWIKRGVALICALDY